MLVLAGLTRVPVHGRPLPGNLDLGSKCLLVARIAAIGKNAHTGTTAASPPEPSRSCRIKGNISKSGKIYHVPGSGAYEKTLIDESKGERWFCSEDEAKVAGWRAPKA